MKFYILIDKLTKYISPQDYWDKFSVNVVEAELVSIQPEYMAGRAEEQPLSLVIERPPENYVIS